MKRSKPITLTAERKTFAQAFVEAFRPELLTAMREGRIPGLVVKKQLPAIPLKRK